MNEKKTEVQRMTDKQFAAHLESLKIIVEQAKDKSEILKAIQSLSNDSRKSQEEITAEIQKLGKNIADELSILDESTRMLLVASVLDNLERAGK